MPYDPSDLPEETEAIRPVRPVGDHLRVYTAFTSARGPEYARAWVRKMLLQARVVGKLETDDADIMLDVLDEEGDIIDEVPIDREAFEYLRRKLRFRWENRDECVS